MKKINSTEYVVKAKNAKGEIFVPNAFQKDIVVALKVYQRTKNSFEMRTKGAKVIMERRRIETIVEDYTETAEKMLKES